MSAERWIKPKTSAHRCRDGLSGRRYSAHTSALYNARAQHIGVEMEVGGGGLLNSPSCTPHAHRRRPGIFLGAYFNLEFFLVLLPFRFHCCDVVIFVVSTTALL